MDKDQEEYEIQLYDFSVSDFAEQSQQMLKEVVSSTVRAALAKVHKTTDGCDQPKEEEQALEKVIDKINQRISMTAYEEMLQKHLTIPAYVLLPDDKKHDVKKNINLSDSDVINMQIQSRILESEVTETAKIIRSLEEELARYEKVKQSIADAEDMLEILADKMGTDLHTTAQRKSIKHIESIILENKENCY